MPPQVVMICKFSGSGSWTKSSTGQSEADSVASPLDQNSITGCGLFPAAAEDNTRLYKNFTSKFDTAIPPLLHKKKKKKKNSLESSL